MTDSTPLTATAEVVERYIQTHLFDPVGLMYSGIDAHKKPAARATSSPRASTRCSPRPDSTAWE